MVWKVFSYENSYSRFYAHGLDHTAVCWREQALLILKTQADMK